jgi:hypothetical protein
MVTTVQSGSVPTGLDADLHDFEAGSAAEATPDQAAADAEADAAMKAIEAGAAKVVLGLLKAARAWLAKRLPEIREEWPDEVLQGPADAAVPLLRKHMQALMQIAGANPELAVFCLSLVPLVMGWLAAEDKASQRLATEQGAGAPKAELVSASAA